MRTHLLSIVLLLTFIGSMFGSFDSIKRVDEVLVQVTTNLDKESNDSEKKKELPKEEEEDQEEKEEKREREELDKEDSKEEKKEDSSTTSNSFLGSQLSLDQTLHKRLVATKFYHQQSIYNSSAQKLYILYSCLKVAYS